VAGLCFDGLTYTAVILTSPDGTSWTHQNVAAPVGVRSIIWAEAGSLPWELWRHPDILGWKRLVVRDSGITTELQLHDVSYGNGIFLTVGTEGTIMTSPDGRLDVQVSPTRRSTAERLSKHHLRSRRR